MAAIRQIEDRMVLRNFFTAGDGTIVDTSTRKIQALDDAGATTTEPTFVVSYADTNGSTLTLATNVGSLNGTTPVDLIGAPASGSQRAVSEISIYNADSVQHTVTIRLLDSATPYIIGKFVVPPSYTLFYDPDLGWRVGATTGPGTVTSVGLTVPGVLFTSPVSGSPVTGAGTFALALKTQTKNTFLSGPSSGADATPTFRAIVAADVPDLSATYQPLDGDLTALANNATNGLWARTGAGTGAALTLAASSPLSMANGDGVAGAPTVSFANQTANTVLAGPTSGGAAGPAFRALVAADLPGSFNGFANPTGTVGLAAANGVLATAMRSDAAPPLDQGIIPTWTGIHTFSSAVHISDGSVSAPGLQLGTNTTGFYNTTSTTDQLGVAVNGVGVARFSLNTPTNNRARIALGGDFDPGSSAIGIRSDATGAGSLTITAESSGTMSLLLSRASSDNTGPQYNSNKARGAIGALTAIVQNDRIGNYQFLGYEGAAYREVGILTVSCIAATPSSSSMTGQMTISLTNSGITRTEVMRLEVATGLSMFGANPIIDANRQYVASIATAAIQPTLADATTNVTSDVAMWNHSTSGTAAANFGSQQSWTWENASGNQILGGRFGFRWVTATNAAEDSEAFITTIQGGALQEKIIRFTPRGYVVSPGNTRVTADFTKTTDTTLANVTGLTANVAAGKTYHFRAWLPYAADVTGGHKYAIAGTATATDIRYHIKTVDDASNLNVITSTQTALAGSAGQAGSTAGETIIEGTITVNAAGTLTVQFAQNASSGSSSVKRGATFIVTEID
jgi:hypothetical protein